MIVMLVVGSALLASVSARRVGPTVPPLCVVPRFMRICSVVFASLIGFFDLARRVSRILLNGLGIV